MVMTDLLLGLLILSILATLALQVLLLRRKTTVDILPLQLRLEEIERGQERAERQIREEIAKNRQESLLTSRQTREETGAAVSVFGNSLQARMVDIAGLQKNQLDSFARQLTALIQTNEQKFDLMREEAGSSSTRLRDDVSSALKNFNDSVLKGMTDLSALLKKEIELFGSRIEKMGESNEGRIEAMRNTLETRLKQIQDDNTRQLDQMRATVDEKLQGTLDRRLGESFKQVSDRLEQVHKGLGEMQTLATGVGDLKKVLTNVKTRGAWGEIQLEALLEQILSPDQYERNVRPDEGSREVVEFAIKLPGREDGDERPVWLPIDAKFPVEDYHRLVEAQENADPENAEASARMLSARIRACAKDICDKYLRPPHTTDFGIMFLPTEGLYAEAVRRPGLIEAVQRDCRVVIAGPTTIAALLNSLQMGFRTLAIQRRSSEVWNLLGAVKAQFGKFGEVLDGVKRKLDQASNTMDGAARRSRAIERRLRDVQELPPEQARMLMEEPDDDKAEPDEA